MTDLFDPGDDRHRAIKRELMHGIALKEIATFREVNRALETAGFEVMEGLDLAGFQHGPITPWYQPMETRGGLLGGAFLRSPMGRQAVKWGTRMAEYLGVFPKGSAEVVSLLDRTASAYVAGGRAGIFTPLYCFVARRPLRG